jgi:hypothetical protein
VLLQQVSKKLVLKSGDKTLDIVVCAHISAMVGILNLYLDPDLSYTWRKALIIVSKAQGCGSSCACSICQWILHFVWQGKLPYHKYSSTHSTIL